MTKAFIDKCMTRQLVDLIPLKAPSGQDLNFKCSLLFGVLGILLGIYLPAQVTDSSELQIESLAATKALALSSLSQSVANSPQLTEVGAYHTLAYVQLQQFAEDSALELLQSLSPLIPSMPVAEQGTHYLLLGQAHDLLGNIELSLKNFDQAIATAESAQAYETWGKAYDAKAQIIKRRDGWAAAASMFNMAREAFRQAGSQEQVLRLKIEAARAALQKNAYDQALSFLANLEDSLPVKSLVQLDAALTRAEILIRKNVDEEALAEVEKALKLAELADHTVARATGYAVLSNYYLNRFKIAEGQEYAQQGLALLPERPTQIKYQLTYRLVATSLLTGKVDTAFALLEEVQQAAQAFQDRVFESRVLLFKGDLLVRLQQVDAGRAQILRALDYFETTQDTARVVVAKYMLARNSFERKQFGESQTFLNDIIDLSQDYPVDIRTQVETFLLQAQADSAQGRFVEAYNYLSHYASLRDSQITQRYREEVAEQETRFNTAQKEAQIRDLQQQEQIRELTLARTRQQRNLFIALAVIFILATSIIVVLARRISRQRNLLDQANQTKDRLFSMLAHDLRGPVSGFRNLGRIFQLLIKKGDQSHIDALAEQLDEQASKVHRLLENLLVWSLQERGLYQPKTEDIPVEELLQEVSELHQQSALAKNLTLSVDAGAELTLAGDRRGLLIALNNLVANAIKFTEKGSVNLVANEEDGALRIEVVDTGVGMPQALQTQLLQAQPVASQAGTAGESGTGLGWQLVRDLIQRNNGRISLESVPDEGTRVILSWT